MVDLKNYFFNLSNLFYCFKIKSCDVLCDASLHVKQMDIASFSALLKIFEG